MKTIPHCISRYLQYIRGPPPRLYNKTSEVVYPLPTGGNVKEWAGKKCSVENCNFELSMYGTGQPERSFPFCPYCFNNPMQEWLDEAEKGQEQNNNEEEDTSDEEMDDKPRLAGRAMTLECPLPDKHPSIEELTVGPDPDGNGVLILDPHLGPKWRLVSTRNPIIYTLPKEIQKITILDKRDEETQYRLMKVEFKADQTPLKDGSTKYTCYFPKDQMLLEMSRIYRGTDRLKRTNHYKKGRGGGGRGGRGGRGRGRGGGQTRH